MNDEGGRMNAPSVLRTSPLAQHPMGKYDSEIIYADSMSIVVRLGGHRTRSEAER